MNIFEGSAQNTTMADASGGGYSDEGCDIDIEYEMLMTSLSNALEIWHLLEIFYIGSTAGTDNNGHTWTIIPQVIEWLQTHYMRDMRMFGESQVLEEAFSAHNMRQSRAEDTTGYWPLVFNMITRGEPDQAASLIRLHSVAASAMDSQRARGFGAGVERNPEGDGDLAAFARLDKLLRSRPSPANTAQFQHKGQYLAAWNQWQQKIKELKDDPLIQRDPRGNLAVVLQLLLGDEHTMDTHCHSWYQRLCCSLFYRYPALKSIELLRVVEKVLDKHEDDEKNTAMVDVILDILDFDVSNAINSARRVLNLPWFAAHIGDILDKVRRLLGSRALFTHEQMNCVPSFLPLFVSFLLCISLAWAIRR